MSHPIAPKRRRRWAAILKIELTLVFLMLVAVLLIIAARVDRNTDIRKERITEPQVHVITMEPKETPVPQPAPDDGSVRYPVPLDDELQQWIITKSEEKGVDPALVLAIIAVETRGTWNPNAVGDNGQSLGLMQIYQTYHTQRCIDLGVFNLFDPYQNIAVGVDILAELSDGGKPAEWVLMAYNGGAVYADKRMENGDISRYARCVMALQNIYSEEST